MNSCVTAGGLKQGTHTFSLMMVYKWRAPVKVGLIHLCKRLFSLNARIYYKLKSGT